MRSTFPTQATATRYLKAAMQAGANPTELRIEPDGTVRVILGDGTPRLADGTANPCDRLLE